MSGSVLRYAEMELLRSMFRLGTELVFPDYSLVNGNNFPDEALNIESAVDFVLKISESMELSVHLPPGYPSGDPEHPVKPIITFRLIDVRSSLVSERSLSTAFNRWLEQASNSGEPVLCSAIEWLRDAPYREAETPINPDQTCTPSLTPVTMESTVCLWIVSHHIRSPIKRRLILTWAGDLHLGGCSMPGRPGLVVAEGLESNASEFWNRLRGLQWKAIQLRHRELLGTSTYREVRFPDGFHELILSHQSRFMWLHDRGVTSALYQLVFGIPGRLPKSIHRDS